MKQITSKNLPLTKRILPGTMPVGMVAAQVPAVALLNDLSITNIQSVEVPNLTRPWPDRQDRPWLISQDRPWLISQDRQRHFLDEKKGLMLVAGLILVRKIRAINQ